MNAERLFGYIGCMETYIATEALQDYAEEHTTRLSHLLTELLGHTDARTGKLDWSIGKVQGQFLKMLVALTKAKKVVEIGTLTGFSALIMAEALPPDGQIITCENDPLHAQIARSFFRRSPAGKKIRLVFGDALRTLSRLPAGGTDGVFIDADRSNYSAYYEESLRILKDGGWIAVDNVMWDGEVINGNTADPDVVAIKAFNRLLRDDERVDKVMLTIRDGVYLIRKR